ncbi:MAG: DUF3795 domain-containing protein [Candidatus Cloacimonadaceae bacterium]|nr:DUF3795 domain-containing protein [Candidatus Cloacimonadaceae bacterium]
MEKYSTYCGLYCGACSSMIIYEKQNGDASVSSTPLPEGETPCSGCNHDPGNTCEIVQCNFAHGTQCCGFCPEFPCATIQHFNDTEWPHHADVIENLRRIKEIGMQEWLQEQSLLWSCPECHTRTHWYQKNCQNCGKKLAGGYE